MNAIIQNILIVLALVLALGFLVKKFFLKSSKSKNGCGNDDCNCH